MISDSYVEMAQKVEKTDESIHRLKVKTAISIECIMLFYCFFFLQQSFVFNSFEILLQKKDNIKFAEMYGRFLFNYRPNDVT